MTRLSTDVMDIGQKSERLAGDGILGTGLMDAAFQWRGIIPVDIETLNRCQWLVEQWGTEFMTTVYLL